MNKEYNRGGSQVELQGCSEDIRDVTHCKDSETWWVVMIPEQCENQSRESKEKCEICLVN